MPLPHFHRPSPRLDDSPAPSSVSRFSVMQNNVRSILNGSSVYSNSPPPSNNNTPKLPLLGFLRRPHSPPSLPLADSELRRDSTYSQSPLRPQHTAGSYIRAINSEDVVRGPVAPEMVHTRNESHSSYGSVDPETEHLAEIVNHSRRRRKRRRRTRAVPERRAWIRKRGERGVCFPFVKSPAARTKCTACLISGLFLIVVLTIYLSIALTRPHLGQEVHILFIMVILCTTIFFCHSLIRLCMLALRPESDLPHIPSMTGPDGFKPIRPIRVHLARDEEIGVGSEAAEVEAEPEKEKVQMPPPAYGLWRSSVRVDPNLLHWQRADAAEASGALPATRPPSVFPSFSSHPNSRSGSLSNIHQQAPAPADRVEEPASRDPRPPSYVSDDGVAYVVAAVPRSVAPSVTGMSDVHPAWRPGFAV
ncbi:uncharacterized protein BDZ99DRAFT_247555 [Mytilinidion resinicola]|uniref:Uncharacterized protein n=1 Tax=Mytilinidion resinicola TaxID=574789 RepID=A0A6A6YYL3_9PEZI|nr:uncharacterized protein BDZ99DRAFT_247555 [Mytilinidion resinicola]KAF2813015.1 hypothetical protein BDZ99DRAFT_247555 [Mytilinidion resinicola]